MATTLVKDCGTCPMLGGDNWGVRCQHPNAPEEVTDIEVAFANCPLRTEPIVIAIKDKQNFNLQLNRDDKETSSIP